MIRTKFAAVAVLLAASSGGIAAAQQPDRLSEVYGDWTVNCVARDDGRACAMVQALTASDNERRVLQAEIQVDGGVTRLVLLGPFGVLLEAGVAARIDGEDLRTFPYRTCLPAGCVVEAQLSAEEVARIRRGSQLGLRLRAADTGTDVDLALSLAGVSAALNRLDALAK